MSNVTDIVEKYLKTETVIMTDYSVIDRIIDTYFDLTPGSFDMTAMDEVGSDQHSVRYEVNVWPEYDPEDEEDMEYINAVKNKEPIGGTQVILRYLCFLGVIPEGKYIIDVSW